MRDSLRREKDLFGRVWVYSRLATGIERMKPCHPHNFVNRDASHAERRYGIRVALPSGDPFRNILGEGWERFHWYPSEAERDRAFDAMATRHGYYRNTDTPSQVLEKITR